jgi:hypothetical protein
MVSMTYGSIIIDNVNVTYPAVIGDIEYLLYMHNVRRHGSLMAAHKDIYISRVSRRHLCQVQLN